MRSLAAPSLAALLVASLSAPAGEPPREPILRIETGMHISAIWRIGVDRSGSLLATVSDDKTLRLWELPSGRPLKVLRPPIGDEREGNLRAVALSPDGGTVVAGGEAGASWDGTNSVYVFSTATGELLRRITGFSDAIRHLAYSPDGRHLVVCLGGKSGIRLFDARDWRQLGDDRDYGDTSNGASFSWMGRLVTTSYDGSVRLYDVAAGTLRLIKNSEDGELPSEWAEEPLGVAFSPDGKRIAVGFNTTKTVAVLSAEDLSLKVDVDESGIEGRLGRVAWSSDGESLYAGGSWSRDGVTQIRAWSRGGKGSRRDVAAATNTIMDLRPLPASGIVFGAGDPAFGIIDKEGIRTLYVPPRTADHRDESVFSVSPNGLTVQFRYSPALEPHRFTVATRTIHLGREPVLSAPVVTGLDVQGWRNGRSPKLGGILLKLGDAERSHSLSVAQDRSRFLLGTSKALRLFDSSGRETWKRASEGVVWAVNIAPDGRLGVAAYGDGTIRWHRMSDGQELLALFPHNDRKRWVLFTPSGYYDSSPGGEDLIGWHVNNGKDRAADFFPASRFRDRFYRPDVIDLVLKTLDEREAVRQANAATQRKEQSTAVAQILPPVINILSPADGTEISSATLTVRYSLRSQKPITTMRVLVDGRPVSAERGAGVRIGEVGETRELAVTVPERDTTVTVVAESENGAGVPASIQVKWKGRAAEGEAVLKPKLYVLAVGVGKYRDPGFNLAYPAKDARDFVEAVSLQKGALYREVVTKVLTDEGATKDDVLDGLDWIRKQTTSRDVAMVFFAGHGVNDDTGSYFFLPHNADPEKLLRTAVGFGDIKTTVANIAGKALFFVDTCHAGNVMGRRSATDVNALVNELSGAENGVVVFSSSTGRQTSLEDASWENGAFTKALVEGLRGKADLLGKGKITINTLDAYVGERVKELTKGKQAPTTVKPPNVPDFPVAVRF